MEETKNSRKEAYAIIKECCLQEEIKQTFGKNFTQVSNKDLWEFINDNVDIVDEKSVEEIYDDIKAMVEVNVLKANDLDALVELLTELSARLKELAN